MKVTSLSLYAGGLHNAIAACIVICAGATHFGPNNCVSLTRSRASTCVLRTQCQGLDLSNFEFAFDCDTGSDVIETHSFGLGGFDPVEEFDTEVKCQQCLEPSTSSTGAASQDQPPEEASQEEATLHQARSEGDDDVATQYHPAPPSMMATAQRKHSNQRGSSGFNVSEDSWADSSGEAIGFPVQYGPKGCVTTYKSSEGHCIMETSCEEEDIQNYEFGLVCVDDVGMPTKHLFGKGSFDPVETFDTLIVCEQCLGLEDIPDEVALNGQVAMLSKEVEDLKLEMGNVTKDVAKLNKKVFGANMAPAPAAATPPASQMLLHHRKALRRIVPHRQATHHHLRLARDRRRQEESDEEDEPRRPKRHLRHPAERSERLINANEVEQVDAEDTQGEDDGSNNKVDKASQGGAEQEDAQDDQQDE
mmetsp:Transcript_64908/g.120797  ORF Transcript_64908/g.120797 Transcript_64908/m.120797 type:complete len:419 (-) Transcript_64908:82-1338(-)